MEIRIVALGRPARRGSPAEILLAEYCARTAHYASCAVENSATEEKFFASLERGSGAATGSGRTRPVLVLLDSRGRAFATEEFADWLRKRRDEGTQRMVFAVGPASGWSAAARGRAGLLLSFGAMTLPHELAAVVLAEQIYRAFTIIEGHPYHLGHA